MKGGVNIIKTYFNILRLTEEEKGYLIGFFIGDGYIKKGKTQVIFALSLDDVKHGILNKLKLILEKSGKKTWICNRKNKSIQLVLSSRRLVDYFRETVSFEDGNKSKTAQLIRLDYSADFFKGFLSGLIDSDGNANRYAFISTISYNLGNQIIEVCIRLNIHTSEYRSLTSKSNTARKIALWNSDVKREVLPSVKLQNSSWFNSKRRKDLWIIDVVNDLPKTFTFADVVKKSSANPSLVWVLLNDRLIRKRHYLKRISRGIYQKTFNFMV
jgi:hypothetical protein